MNDKTRREIYVAMDTECSMRWASPPIDPKAAGVGRAIRAMKRMGYDFVKVEPKAKRAK